MARSRLFRFNLLPPKSVSEIKQQVRRDDTALYSILLVFFAALIFGVLAGVNILIIQPRLDSSTLQMDSRLQRIETLKAIRALNGELVVKTQLLKSVLEQRIDPSEIFRVADALVQGQAYEVAEYGRDKDGKFVFTLILSNFNQVPGLIKQAKEIKDTSNVFVTQSQLNENDQVRVTLSLNINTISEAETNAQ